MERNIAAASRRKISQRSGKAEKSTMICELQLASWKGKQAGRRELGAGR